jgi:protein transport protein SEC20
LVSKFRCLFQINRLTFFPDASTASLKATSTTHDLLTGLLGTSKQLVTALEKADWLDRILIFAALAFFVLVVLFILKQRIVNRGLRIAFWWTRFLPSIGRSDPPFDAKEVNVDKAAVTSQSVAAVVSSIIATSSTATALASQVAHATESDWDVLSTGTPEKGVSDTLPTYEDLGSPVGSILLETTSTLQVTETRPSESIHDEL